MSGASFERTVEDMHGDTTTVRTARLVSGEGAIWLTNTALPDDIDPIAVGVGLTATSARELAKALTYAADLIDQAVTS